MFMHMCENVCGDLSCVYVRSTITNWYMISWQGTELINLFGTCATCVKYFEV